MRTPAAALAILGRQPSLAGSARQPATAASALALRARVPWRDVGFVAAWEVQARVATMAMIALVAFVSIWIALAVMLIWALLATATYHSAQRRGRPDLLKNTWPKADSNGRPRLVWLGGATLSVVRAWFAGLQPFLYSRAFGGVLARSSSCRWTCMAKVAILSIGLTLFGVTACNHLLRAAGYSDGKVLKLSLLGPFLNVPYRVLLSAFVVGALMRHISPPLV